MRCTYCGSRWHTVDYCPKTARGQPNRATLRCTYCGSKTHNRDGCPRAWPTPPGNPRVNLRD